MVIVLFWMNGVLVPSYVTVKSNAIGGSGQNEEMKENVTLLEFAPVTPETDFLCFYLSRYNAERQKTESRGYN